MKEISPTLSECWDKATGYIFQLLAGNETWMKTPPKIEDDIDSETPRITKICFAFALVSSLVHLFLNVFFSGIRRLYGAVIFCGLLLTSITYSTILASCSTEPESKLYRAFSSAADFFILATIATNFVATIFVAQQFMSRNIRSTFDSFQKTYHPSFNERIDKWCVIRCLFYCIISLFIPAFVVTMEAIFDTGPELNITHNEFSNVPCNLKPNATRFYVFFPLLALFILAQLISVMVSSQQYLLIQRNPLVAMQLSYVCARYWITTKMAITYCFVWIAAFVSLYYRSVAFWHVFTLLSSLQAIYITVNSSFSRPVLDVIHHWYDEKTEELKTEQALHYSACHLTNSMLIGIPNSNP